MRTQQWLSPWGWCISTRSESCSGCLTSVAYNTVLIQSLRQVPQPSLILEMKHLKGSWRAAGPWSLMKPENPGSEMEKASSSSSSEVNQLGGKRGALFPVSGPLFILAIPKRCHLHLGRSSLNHWVNQDNSSGEVPFSCDSNFWQVDIKTTRHRVHRDAAVFLNTSITQNVRLIPLPQNTMTLYTTL